MQPPILEARGLMKRYGKTQALAGLDLVVNPGRVVALLGPNGAGKTTFVRAGRRFRAQHQLLRRAVADLGGGDLRGVRAPRAFALRAALKPIRQQPNRGTYPSRR